MSFVSYVQNGFSMLAYRQDAVRAIADDASSFTYALTILLGISGIGALLVAGALGLAGFSGGKILLLLIGSFVAFAALGLATYGVMHLSATLFGGKGALKQFIAVALALSIAVLAVNLAVMVLSLIPLLGALITLAATVWYASLQVFIIKETYALSWGRAVGAWLVPVVIGAILYVVLLVSLLAPYVMMLGVY